jgi:hypothetical protein
VIGEGGIEVKRTAAKSSPRTLRLLKCDLEWYLKISSLTNLLMLSFADNTDIEMG